MTNRARFSRLLELRQRINDARTAERLHVSAWIAEACPHKMGDTLISRVAFEGKPFIVQSIRVESDYDGSPMWRFDGRISRKDGTPGKGRAGCSLKINLAE